MHERALFMFNAPPRLDQILHNRPYPPRSSPFLRQPAVALSKGALGPNYLEIASSCCRSATVSPQSQVPSLRPGETQSSFAFKRQGSGLTARRFRGLTAQSEG